ncbi:uncharacterized protein [Prorops nasuta]|uniref:uncharacterized protein n=1 Tax=Prorops nasuta TaxID=863751 RepID=UPI0034CE75E3
MWKNDKLKTKEEIKNEVNRLYENAISCFNDEVSKVWKLTTLGLKLDPRFYQFYALRADLLARESKWTRAIENYERAKIMLKINKIVKRPNDFYKNELINCYKKRADHLYKNGCLLESASNYEQLLKLSENIVEIQDKLLDILKTLGKYEAFCYYWNQFLQGADSKRISALKTKRADYKIHLKEIKAARQILLEALKLDNKNKKAQQMMQTIYNIGRTMATHSVIWCMHGCYDKALIAIEKCRDCDPYNPDYTLLKTVILRLCGRVSEAIAWLESVNKEFYKLLQHTKDTKGFTMGNLSVEQTRKQLIKQWRSLHN